MRNINLTTAGAICAVLTTLSFVVGVAFSAGSGVQTIIPDTGKDAIVVFGDALAAEIPETDGTTRGGFSKLVMEATLEDHPLFPSASGGGVRRVRV